ncbi:MAG: hypothetical protein AB1778_03565 [Candidatus Bipolaricaulota bacterium]
MVRPLRIEYAGAVYHVTCRSNAREKVFLVDPDRELLLNVLADAVKRFNWRCLADLPDDRPLPLLIETVEPTLSHGMCPLNGTYTQESNRPHRRTGHVFPGGSRPFSSSETRTGWR